MLRLAVVPAAVLLPWFESDLDCQFSRRSCLAVVPAAASVSGFTREIAAANQASAGQERRFSKSKRESGIGRVPNVLP